MEVLAKRTTTWADIKEKWDAGLNDSGTMTFLISSGFQEKGVELKNTDEIIVMAGHGMHFAMKHAETDIGIEFLPEEVN